MSRKANYQLWIDEAVKNGRGKELIDWFNTYRLTRPLTEFPANSPEELKSLMHFLADKEGEPGQNIARKIRAAWIQKTLRDTRPEKAQTFVLTKEANQKIERLAIELSTYKNVVIEQAIESFFSGKKELSKIMKNERVKHKEKNNLLIQRLKKEKNDLSKILDEKEKEICELKAEIEKQSKEIDELLAE